MSQCEAVGGFANQLSSVIKQFNKSYFSGNLIKVCWLKIKCIVHYSVTYKCANEDT
jgi:hypothetical protein